MLAGKHPPLAAKLLLGAVLLGLAGFGVWLWSGQGGIPQAELPPLGESEISWGSAVILLEECRVSAASQTHNRDVYLVLEDGREVHTIEPEIDDIFDVLARTNERCGPIPIATE